MRAFHFVPRISKRHFRNYDMNYEPLSKTMPSGGPLCYRTWVMRSSTVASSVMVLSVGIKWFILVERSTVNLIGHIPGL